MLVELGAYVLYSYLFVLQGEDDREAFANKTQRRKKHKSKPCRNLRIVNTGLAIL